MPSSNRDKSWRERGNHNGSRAASVHHPLPTDWRKLISRELGFWILLIADENDQSRAFVLVPDFFIFLLFFCSWLYPAASSTPNCDLSVFHAMLNNSAPSSSRGPHIFFWLHLFGELKSIWTYFLMKAERGMKITLKSLFGYSETTDSFVGRTWGHTLWPKAH